jgi:hypothetical protein
VSDISTEAHGVESREIGERRWMSGELWIFVLIVLQDNRFGSGDVSLLSTEGGTENTAQHDAERQREEGQQREIERGRGHRMIRSENDRGRRVNEGASEEGQGT